MKLHYDKEADALYVRFSANKIERTETVSRGVNLDFDANHELVGIEVLFVSQRLHGESPESVNFEVLLGHAR